MGARGTLHTDMKAEQTLLVIENEQAIVGFLRSSLKHSGWKILEARTARSGLEMASSCNPNVILLDMGLPSDDALGCLNCLRQWTSIPVILMVCQKQKNEQMAGLEAGADDYLVKPFGVAELVSRLQLAMRHSKSRLPPVLPIYEHQGLRVDLVARRVWFHKKEVHLSPLQYKFLAVLVRGAGRVVGHRELVDQVWGAGHKVTPGCMRVFVYQIRKKTEVDPTQPRSLKTHPGIGYRLESRSCATDLKPIELQAL